MIEVCSYELMVEETGEIIAFELAIFLVAALTIPYHVDLYLDGADVARDCLARTPA